MQENFEITKFMNNLSQDLITVFDRSSQQGTHPEEVGRTKEIKITKQLEAILPFGVGIGRGKVIDSQGNTSRQCDIILYEKNIIPVFVSDDNVDFSYYPCEGVIAVGEIKSTLTIEELNESLTKLEKVKKMQRSPLDGNSWRPCLSTFTLHASKTKAYDPINKTLDSIYTFIFSNKDSIAEDTIMEIITTKYTDSIHLAPNTIYSLNKPLYYKIFSDERNDIKLFSDNPNCYVAANTDKPFEQLVFDLSYFIQNARTQRFIFEDYYKQNKLTVNKCAFFKS